MSAVLFDLDGTLIVSEGAVSLALADASREHGLPWNDTIARWAVGRTWDSVFAELEKPLPVAGRSSFRSRTLELYEAHDLVLVPGARALVHQLVGQVPVGIVTGSTRPQLERAIDVLGLRGLLNVTVSEEDVARSKPHPEPYQRAMRHLGVGRALIFEDSAAGIAAGVAAGCHVVAVRHADEIGQDQSGAHEAVEDLLEVTLAWCRSRL